VNLAVSPYYAAYANDGLFDADSPLNRNDCLSFYRVLRARIEAHGGFCHTLDVCRREGLEPDVVLFFDMPPQPVELALEGWSRRPQAWIALQECQVIRPENWLPESQAQFSKIFTWADPFVDGERYLKLNFPNALFVPEPLDLDSVERNLCTLVAADKSAPGPLELYSARRGAIRWFEEHHPDQFDLYGMGWDREQYPSYRGTIDSKLDVVGRYWFSICFENARDIPGYMTEKLFDCFLARNVPVYWGASNVADLVDPEAFIDVRRFDGMDDLYDFLVAIEPDEYERYLAAARRWLASDAARQFTNEGNADVVVGALLDLDGSGPEGYDEVAAGPGPSSRSVRSTERVS
jgi:hypothetical protein